MKRAGPTAVWVGRLGLCGLYVRRVSGSLDVNETWVCGKRTKEVRKVAGLGRQFSSFFQGFLLDFFFEK